MAQDKKKKAPAMKKATRSRPTATAAKKRADRVKVLQAKARVAAKAAKAAEKSGSKVVRDRLRKEVARLNAATRKARRGP